DRACDLLQSLCAGEHSEPKARLLLGDVLCDRHLALDALGRRADAAADLSRARALLLALRDEGADGAALAQPLGRVLMYAGHDSGLRGAWVEAEAEMREALEWHACAADGDDPAGHLAYALLATRSSMADLLALEGKKADALALRLAVTADMDQLVE